MAVPPMAVVLEVALGAIYTQNAVIAEVLEIVLAAMAKVTITIIPQVLIMTVLLVAALEDASIATALEDTKIWVSVF